MSPPRDLPVESLHRLDVPGHGMIAVVSPKHSTQPCALHFDRLVTADLHLLAQFLELGDLPLCHRATQHKVTYDGSGIPVVFDPADNMIGFA